MHNLWIKNTLYFCFCCHALVLVTECCIRLSACNFSQLYDLGSAFSNWKFPCSWTFCMSVNMISLSLKKSPMLPIVLHGSMTAIYSWYIIQSIHMHIYNSYCRFLFDFRARGFCFSLPVKNEVNTSDTSGMSYLKLLSCSISCKTRWCNK